IDRLKEALTTFKNASSARASFLILCPDADQPNGEDSLRLKEAFSSFHEPGHFEVWRTEDLLAHEALNDIYDPEGDRVAHLPYTDAFFVAPATAMGRRRDLIPRPPIKVLAWDCDHPLWAGVCGEEPIEGLAVTPAHRQRHDIMLRS